MLSTSSSKKSKLSSYRKEYGLSEAEQAIIAIDPDDKDGDGIDDTEQLLMGASALRPIKSFLPFASRARLLAAADVSAVDLRIRATNLPKRDMGSESDSFVVTYARRLVKRQGEWKVVACSETHRDDSSLPFVASVRRVKMKAHKRNGHLRIASE